MSTKQDAVEIIKSIVKTLPGISGGRLCSQVILDIKQRNLDIDPGDLVGIIGSMVSDGFLTEVDYRLPYAKHISHTLFFPGGTTVKVSPDLYSDN